MNHLPFSLLIDFVDRKLNPEEQREVEAHLTTCSSCQHELTLARGLLDAACHPTPEAQSTDLIRRAVAAFRRQQRQAAQRLQIAATLQFDNLAQVAALGARGVAKERQLLYAFDEFDLDLQVEAEDHTLILRGQLLAHTPSPAGLEGITLRLISRDVGPWLRLTDELGCFQISGLITGVYTLHILLGDRDVVVEPLVLPG